MCLVVHRDTQKKIAEEDITVYKELRHIYENVVSACYKDCNYRLEKLYTNDFGLNKDAIKNFITDNKEGKKDNSNIIWMLIVLQEIYNRKAND